MSAYFYLVVAKDRHTDDEYWLFGDLGKSVGFAKELVDDMLADRHYDKNDADLEYAENEWENTIFSARWNEGYSVHIEAIELKGLLP